MRGLEIYARDYGSFKDQLKSKGYKLTPQRRAILDTIIDNQGNI